MIISNIPKSIHSKEKIDCKCDLCSDLFVRRYDNVIKSRLIYENKDICRNCNCKKNGEKLKGKKRPKETTEKVIATRTKNHKTRCPDFTIDCKCCGKLFIVPYGQRDRMYCGKSCQAKSQPKRDSKNTSICIICEKEFKHYGERITCGRECNAQYMSISRIGENNPNSADKQNTTCLHCGNEFSYSRFGLHKGQSRVFCSLACSHAIDLRGNPLSGMREYYPKEFNEKLKNQVKQRDNHCCQLCNCCEILCVHHIDYNKENIDLQNLITLCRTCHNATNSARTFWEIIFAGLISGSKIIKKEWGAEIHIANNNNYCLKYLIFFKNKQFSHHTHQLKTELWHCVYGEFECVLETNNVKDYFIFKQGDKVEINPGVIHQLQARKNSILVEVSTRDYPEDSIRIIRGIN